MPRPRTTALSEEEMIALGEEMIQWLKLHPQTLHLSEWYTIEKGFIYNEWKVFINKQEFYPYYERALKIVGKQYLDKTSNVRDGISQRWQRVYFKDLKDQEDEDLDAAAKRAKYVEEDKEKNSEICKKLDQLASEFSSNSNLKNVEIQINSEA